MGTRVDVDVSGWRQEAQADADERGTPKPPLTEGWYGAKVKSAEAEVLAKNGQSKMLVVVFDVDGGEQGARRVNAYLIYKHKTSRQAMEIGRKKIGALLNAIDYQGNGLDPDALVGAELDLLLRPDGTYNAVVGFEAAGTR